MLHSNRLTTPVGRELESKERQTDTSDRVALALDAAETGVWEWDLQSESIWLTAGAARILGLPSNELSLTKLLTLIHSDDLDRMVSAAKKIAESDDRFENEIRIVGPDGKTYWLAVRGRCLRDARGVVKRSTGTVQDITERKSAEVVVAQNESRLRATLDCMLEGCQILDFELRYLYLNANAQRHARRPAEELIGRRMVEAYPDIVDLPVYAAIQRCLKDGDPVQLESRFVFSDGSVGVFDLNILPASEGVVILSYEITEQKLAEESLLLSESRLKTAQRAAGLGVWEWNLADGVWWSEELCLVFGREPSACESSMDEFMACIPADTQLAFKTAIQQTLETDSPYQIEHQILRSDGTIRWLVTHGIVERDFRKAPMRFWGICQDITRRKLAEEELRTNERQLRESEERFRLALDAAEQGTWKYVFATDDVWMDGRCQAHQGIERSRVTSGEILAKIHPTDLQNVISAATVAHDAIDGDGSFSCEYRIESQEGTFRWIALTGKYQFSEVAGERAALQIHGTTRNITQRKQAELAVHKQSLVLEQIAAGEALTPVLQAIVDFVEEQIPGSYGSIHLVDRRHDQLRFAAGRNLPPACAEAITSVPIAPGTGGALGMAAHSGKTEITTDIATDPLWLSERQTLLHLGIQSCWAVPILTAANVNSLTTADRVLGTFAVFRHEAAAPASGAESVMATAVHLAQLVLDRENSYQAIRQSEARFSAISEITRCVTFALRVNADGSSFVEWARPRFGLLSGYSEEDYKNFGWASIFHPDDRRRLQNLFKNILDGHVGRDEIRVLTKDGQVLTVLIQGKLVDPGPKPGEGLLIGGMLDITELKLAEVALRVSEERFQLALQGANEGLWDWNIESNSVFYSPRWKSILGYVDSELNNDHTTWRELMHQDDRVASTQSLNAFLNGRSENYENEFRMRHKSGQYRNILSRAFVIRDERGRPQRMVGTHQDITERKQADEQLRASRRRMEALSRQLITTREEELRHLARELHDEIGQELTLMKMNLRDIQRSADTSFRARLDENITLIERTVSQVRNLSLNMRPPHLDDLGLVATLHWYLKHQAEIAGFQEHLSVVPPDIQVPPNLAIVCFRISQEAVTNAIRHAEPRRIEIELRQNAGELLLGICDDGVGFDVGAARSRASGGASLGLISMQERASLAGGHIEIESVLRRGTKIVARFPLLQS